MLLTSEIVLEELVASKVAKFVECALPEPQQPIHDPYVLTQAILERLG